MDDQEVMLDKLEELADRREFARDQLLQAIREDGEIADNMHSYWANLNAGSER